MKPTFSTDRQKTRLVPSRSSERLVRDLERLVDDGDSFLHLLLRDAQGRNGDVSASEQVVDDHMSAAADRVAAVMASESILAGSVVDTRSLAM